MRASPRFVTFSWQAHTGVEACHELRVWNILHRFMNITPKELKDRLDAGKKFRLIDVREQDEWTFNRIPGAELIPLSQFQKRGPEELAPDEEIVLYCHHGMRSGKAQGFLKAQGYENVLNLSGGIDAWSAQVDPSVPRY
jgi:rhodanese-related sulfurtransferase